MCAPRDSAGVLATACMQTGDERNTGSPSGWWVLHTCQREYREVRARPFGVADGVVVLMKSGSADGGKDPWSGSSVEQSER